jgi:hypothetical protein
VFERIRTFFAKRRVVLDLEIVLSKTFERLLAASRYEDSLKQRFDVSAALASCMGALRDTYPGAIVEDDSMALAFLQANATGSADADPLLHAIFEMVRSCPRTVNDQVDVVTWLIAPIAAQHARKQGAI